MHTHRQGLPARRVQAAEAGKKFEAYSTDRLNTYVISQGIKMHTISNARVVICHSKEVKLMESNNI